jgi:hypothetical protein
MIEHPEITNALRTGYPHGEPEYPHCPICGAETDHIYRHAEGDIIGCEDCVSIESAWEAEECFRKEF